MAVADMRNHIAGQRAAGVVGAAFLLVGIVGFIPSYTTDHDSSSLVGHQSGGMLFGIVQVSVLHNIVHPVFGVAGIRPSTR